MIDSLLTLTDDHLRDHKYLMLSAFLGALKALSSHLQILTFLFYFHQPKLNAKFLFMYIMCKMRRESPAAIGLISKQTNQNYCMALADSSWQIPVFTASEEGSFSALMHSQTYGRERDRAAGVNSKSL